MSLLSADPPCANIGPRQRRRRLYLGTALLTAGLTLIGGLIVEDAPAWWRLGALPLFWVGLLGLFQAREKT